MSSAKADVNFMLMAIAQIIDEGGILLECDLDLNVLSHPVVLDAFLLSKINRENDPPDFWMAWRPIGITARFESGAFTVEDPEFAYIVDFKLEDDRILFTRLNEDGKKDIIVVTPLTDEYREDWEQWNRFKKAKRDIFEDIEMSLAEMLRERELESPPKK